MDLHWRNSQKPPRFFTLDARVIFFIFFFLVHARLWTFSLVVLAMLLFWFFERRGYTFEAAIRALRSWILGRNRPANMTTFRRAWTDFG